MQLSQTRAERPVQPHLPIRNLNRSLGHESKQAFVLPPRKSFIPSVLIVGRSLQACICSSTRKRRSWTYTRNLKGYFLM